MSAFTDIIGHALRRGTERTSIVGLIAIAAPHLSPAVQGEVGTLICTVAGLVLAFLPDPAPGVAPPVTVQLSDAVVDALVDKLAAKQKEATQ